MNTQLRALDYNLLNHVSDGVAVFEQSGNLVYCNKRFEALEPVLKKRLLDNAKSAHSEFESVYFASKRLIKQVDLNTGFAIYVSPERKQQTAAEHTLNVLMQALDEGSDIYQSAAKAIQSCLKWRWVAITRFNGPNRLEVLSFIDHQNPLEKFEYDVAGTPCEMVVDSNKFTVFSDLQRIFPNYEALKEMGAQTYAGLIYRGKDNQPLGHIMAMHDSPDVDFGITADVINIATIAISSQFQLHNTVTQLQSAEKRVRSDGLTGIGNRLAYDDALEQVEESYLSNPTRRWTMAVVDLDRLKPLNDNQGHAAGDNFIKLMASELANLGRESDLAFRMGGDEFAVIFAHNNQSFINVIMSRFNQALLRIRANLQFNVDASICFASLHEVNGDIARWSKLADERMYENKSNHKSFHQNKIQQLDINRG